MLNVRSAIPSALPVPRPSESAWRFSVVCPQADRVLLVRQDEQGLNAWMPMVASTQRPGRWELTVPLDRLHGQFRYYTVEGGSVLNGGTAGLSATRLGPGVKASA